VQPDTNPCRHAGAKQGLRVFVCDNMAFSGAIRPVFAKHSKHFNLIKSLSIGVDQMRRNFKPMMEQVNLWRDLQLPDATRWRPSHLRLSIERKSGDLGRCVEGHCAGRPEDNLLT